MFLKFLVVIVVINIYNVIAFQTTGPFRTDIAADDLRTTIKDAKENLTTALNYVRRRPSVYYAIESLLNTTLENCDHYVDEATSSKGVNMTKNIKKFYVYALRVAFTIDQLKLNFTECIEMKNVTQDVDIKKLFKNSRDCDQESLNTVQMGMENLLEATYKFNDYIKEQINKVRNDCLKTNFLSNSKTQCIDDISMDMLSECEKKTTNILAQNQKYMKILEKQEILLSTCMDKSVKQMTDELLKDINIKNKIDDCINLLKSYNKKY